MLASRPTVYALAVVGVCQRPRRGANVARSVASGAARPRRPASAVAHRPAVVRAAADSPAGSAAGSIYEVTLDKPIGIKFGRGRDGQAYVSRVPKDPRYERFQAGDKILAVSASFGDDVWVAENYGSVMYAIRTRSGGVYLKMLDNGGDSSALLGDAPDNFMRERRGGNYGVGTAEVQRRNYVQAKEVERERTEMFNDALELFSGGKYADAVKMFEDVSGLEPPNYRGDNFAASSDLYKLSQYNVACAYCKLGQVDAALAALEDTMRQGYDDYAKIRGDANLAPARASPKFAPLIDRFDEPFINTNAVNALKSIFSFGQNE